MSSPKAKLHHLYAHCQQPALRYETLPVSSSPSGGDSDDAQHLASTVFLIKHARFQPHEFKCLLHIPDHPAILSDIFTKKKDAEQDAAKKALIQLGISFSLEYTPPKTFEEKMDALANRIEALFSEKVIRSWYPLKEHYRAAIQRKDDRFMMVPAVALAALDNKVGSLCKSMSRSSDCDPVLVVRFLYKAAVKCPSVTFEDGLWIKRIDPFSKELKEDILSCKAQQECLKFLAVYLPSSLENSIRNIEITLGKDEYYMDVLSRVLGVEDAASVMISRTIARAPRDTRVYWPVPKELKEHTGTRRGVSLNGDNTMYNCPLKDGFNSRAADLLGYRLHGDAIIANVGSTWKAEGDFECTDFSVCSYYRLLLGRTPEGNYKLSRKTILVGTLPRSFSSRSQWSGNLPRALLMDFFHHQHLPEPLVSCNCDNESGSINGEKAACTGKTTFMGKVTISFGGEVKEFESERLYRSRNDAINSASLKALHFLSQKVTESGIYPRFHKEERLQSTALEIRNQESFRTIAQGSLISIAYDVFLIVGGLEVNVESHEGFQFESGGGGIIGELETVISGMQVGGFAKIILPVSSPELVLAANEVVANVFPDGGLGAFSLRYEVKVLGLVEPPEERMESALFSPPLSKQRNEFAVRKLQEVHAKSLVDLGCGSGSLLDAVLDSMTDLERIAGVDISFRSLVRAAKSLNSKLNSGHNSIRRLKELILYEGSLAEPDYRLCDFDVATCIEVVEHMDPEPLNKAGEVILGIFAPQVLILSTPNIEYNVVLQKMSVDARMNEQNGELKADEVQQETKNVDIDEDVGSHLPKFRNDDHRFEWTRAEFVDWATGLAFKYGYSVEFTGVGGTEEGPGYASQIAVFTRHSDRLVACYQLSRNGHSFPYTQIWKYDQPGVGIAN